MATSRATRLTYAGLNLLAKCQEGKELHFTRVVLGDGKVTDEQDTRQLGGLVNPKLELPIKSIKITGVGTTVMETELKNDKLDAGFFAREVGIFATDPDDSTETLYAYRNTGDDSEYIPAGGGSEVWNLIYDVVTVVDQATNVTATINGDVAYITRVDFEEHVNSTQPHPNAPSLKDEVTTTDYFWAQKNADKHLHPISLDNARTAILGATSSTIPILAGRVSQTEADISNIYLKMLAENECPDSNLLITEDFVNPDQIDMTAVPVKSINAGSDTIDVSYTSDFIRGSWYWVTDGVHQELVQVKSAIRTTDGVYRVMTMAPIVNTYDVPNTMIYRSTVGIADGVAVGSSDQKGTTWKPGTTWSGLSASQSVSLALASTLEAADNYTLTGDCKFDDAGYLTMDTSIVHNHAIGVALVKTGGGNGTWSCVDEKGDNV